MDTINSWLQHGAQHWPQRIALQGDRFNLAQNGVVTFSEQQLNYQQLEQCVAKTASWLQQQNIARVALRAENSLNWAIADLAALRAGVVLIPVPIFFSAQQTEHLLNSAGVDALWGDWPKQTLDATLGYPALLPLWRRRIEGDHQVHPGTAKITFTSGSTGYPKGVCLSAQQLGDTAQALVKGLTRNAFAIERHLVLLPLVTLLENITGLYVPLGMGATTMIYRGRRVGLEGSSQFDAMRFATAMDSFKPQSLVVTPALLPAVMQLAIRAPEALSDLKLVAVGGARVSSVLLAEAKARGVPAYQGYGLSECGSVVSLNLPDAEHNDSCGKPLDHCQVRIDEQGQVWVSGAVMLGYLGEPAVTGEIATGDLGQLDEQGFLHINGRRKNLLITSYGRNISPEWVESEALGIPFLRQLLVTGDGRAELSALVVVPKQWGTLSDEQLSAELASAISQLNRQLPDYAQLRRVLWVSGSLVDAQSWFTANGRWRRQQVEQALRSPFNQLYQQPLPNNGQPLIQALAHLAPENTQSLTVVEPSA